MSTGNSTSPSHTTLETVWGPAAPLLLVLLGFPGLLSLLFAAGSRNDLPLIHGVFSTLSVGSGLFALVGSAWAVQRQALVQRIWASRLAPQAAARRVAKAVGRGLLVVWAVAALPVLLLGATQGLMATAGAGVSLLAVLMLATTAWACAWQGRLPQVGLLPLGAAVLLMMIQGPAAVWSLWSSAGWVVHALALIACAWALPWVLAVQHRANGAVPALTWHALWRRASQVWQSGRLRVQERGEAAPHPYWAAGFGYPVLNQLRLDGPVWSEGGPWLGKAALTFLTVVATLVLSYGNLFSADLHWRQWLAPGARLRQRLGLRVLAHSATAHLRIALVLVPMVLVLVAMWPWGERVANLAHAADVVACIALCWLLALPAAVFLRGWKTSPARRVLMAAGLLLG